MYMLSYGKTSCDKRNTREWAMVKTLVTHRNLVRSAATYVTNHYDRC
jgi:hypothetical protein